MNPLEKQSEHQVLREEAGALSKSVTLDQIIAEPDDSRHDRDGAAPPLGTVFVGRIVAMQQAVALVDFPANTSGALVQARSLVAVSQREIGREVALAFEENDPAKPLILGLLQVATSYDLDGPEPQQPVEVKIDEDVLTLTAKKEITLRCGKASVTLTSAGKVLIRGEYLLSRSSGVNRIKGGSVQIN
jgi:Domain of unknown function (DUF6484)